ncbi:hypothetical protein HMPREF9946_03089 [Acetobacteraceae bacterium AT-5844]|nr:hypothetical protein HMPREF9946_03089 [Acetobacteraceae bacterium AT-5844]
MAGSVIHRLRSAVDDEGRIRHVECASTWEVADELAGQRVDRRRCYAIIDGELCGLVRWSDACTGCTEVPEMTIGPDRGGGCSECGYQGRVRRAQWVPFSFSDEDA